MSYFKSLKTKMSAGLSFKFLAIAFVLVAAALAIAPRHTGVTRAEKCNNAPSVPTFNPFPVTFQDPPESCKDYALVQGRLENGNYPSSQAELDAGVTAHSGQNVQALIYFHNGAKENLDPNQTTARNFKITTVVDTTEGTQHNITVTLSADNATSITSSFKINTAANEKIELVANSGVLFDFQNNVVQSGFTVGNNVLNMQDLLACFSHSGFVRFTVKVVSTTTLSDNAVCQNIGSVPALQPNQTFSTNVVMQNTGTTTWNNNDRYALKITSTSNLGLPDQIGIPNATTIPPNSSASFTLNGTAPAAPGTYNVSVQMMKGGVVFGAVCPLTIVVQGQTQNPYLTITKHVRSVTAGGTFSSNINVNSGNTVEYKIVVTAHNTTVNNLVVADNFPSGLSYVPNTLTVNGQSHATGLSSGGLQLGNLAAGQSVTIMYQAVVNATSGSIVNTASAYGSNAAQVQAQATVNVSTVYNPVVCTPSVQTINDTQTAYFTASGGNGSYSWSTNGGNPSTGTGSSFTTTYSTAGTKTATVTSNGQSANCTVYVNQVQTPPVYCSPSTQNVNLNQPVYFTATGGNGSYTWYSSTGNPSTGTGSSYTVTYNTVGSRTVSVTSGGQSADCTVYVNQVQNPQVYCSPSTQNVNVGQAAYFTANGGNGSYSWYASNGTPFTGYNSSFSTSFYSTGTQTVTVTSGGQSANCTVYVNQVQNAQVYCSPSSQNINVNQAAYFTANGGNGSYSWYAQDGSPSTGYGSNFSSSFYSSGSKNITVTSNGQSANCTVYVNQVQNAQVYCSPSYQNVNVNQTVSFTANGGNGSYSWYAQDGSPSTGYGTTFSTSYYNTGSRNITVTSGGNSAVCTVTVGSVQGGNVNLNYSKQAFNDTKNVDATSVRASRGDTITYTLKVTNTGNTAADNFVISDDLSQVLDKADLVDNGGATLNGNILTFPGVNVPAGGSVTKSFRVKVKTSLANNGTYVMTNTYGNTVNITITTPQVAGAFIAPTTGASGVSAAVFAALLTLGFVVYKKRESIFSLILN